MADLYVENNLQKIVEVSTTEAELWIWELCKHLMNLILEISSYWNIVL